MEEKQLKVAIAIIKKKPVEIIYLNCLKLKSYAIQPLKKKRKERSPGAFQFQSKGMVKLHFLEQFYIKAKPWHRVKPRRKTTGAQRHFKTALSARHIQHMLDYKGPIPLKSSV